MFGLVLRGVLGQNVHANSVRNLGELFDGAYDECARAGSIMKGRERKRQGRATNGQREWGQGWEKRAPDTHTHSHSCLFMATASISLAVYLFCT